MININNDNDGTVNVTVETIQGNNEDLDNQFQVVRFKQNPIISPGMGRGIGSNINGPSLIKVPDWVPNPLGKYYLYFSHHRGKYIRLAYSDRLEGPWKIYEPGTLQLDQTIYTDQNPTPDEYPNHIASPDVHVNEEKKEILMYFHGQSVPGNLASQSSCVAVSKNGIQYMAHNEKIDDFYLRVFRWDGYYYAFARYGVLHRSIDGLTKWERAKTSPFDVMSSYLKIRHLALKLNRDTLSVFYSRIGDCPEKILLSKIELVQDWMKWKATEPVIIMQPETEYEGIDLPLRPSKVGDVTQRVRELRDPAIYQENGRVYLLYSIAGESGIGIAELKEK